jgi:hypothetical protein
MKHRLVLFISLVQCCLLTSSAGALTENGTSNGWHQVNQSGFGDNKNHGIWTLENLDNKLYAGTNNPAGAQIWRMGANGGWTSMMEGGFGTSTNSTVTDLVDYLGKYYAATFGGEIWRSGNGSNWNRVVKEGFGNLYNSVIPKCQEFKGYLYCGTWSKSDSEGGEMWRSSTGNAGSWTQVAQNGIDGDVGNKSVHTFALHGDHLYVGTENNTTGTEVWRSFDGTDGEQVNSDGFGNKDNCSVYLAAYKDYLYAGTYVSSGSANPGAELWRCKNCSKPAKWVKVPIQKGFGDPQNKKIFPVAGEDGKLYAVTSNSKTGLQVWVSEDGIIFFQINLDGFGDSENNSIFDNASIFYQGFLFVGTHNEDNAGQVWKRAYLTQLPFVAR